jgi:hypothetical protein
MRKLVVGTFLTLDDAGGLGAHRQCRHDRRAILIPLIRFASSDREPAPGRAG